MNDWIKLITEKLQGWYVHFIKMLPNLALAFLIMLIAYYFAKVCRSLTVKLITSIKGKPAGTYLLSTIVYILVLSIGLFFALDILQLDKAVSSLLAGAGILGIVLGFAFQDLSSNFISGIYIGFKKPFVVGDTVETNGFIGNIEDIQLRSTTIRTFSGLHLMIPNKDIFQKPMINYSLTTFRRIEMNMSVSIESDLPKVIQLSREAVEKIDYLYKEKPVEVYYTDIGDGAVKISVWIWINNHLPPGFMVARHDALINLAAAYKENNISIIAPINIQNLKNNLNNV